MPRPIASAMRATKVAIFFYCFSDNNVSLRLAGSEDGRLTIDLYKTAMIVTSGGVSLHQRRQPVSPKRMYTRIRKYTLKYFS